MSSCNYFFENTRYLTTKMEYTENMWIETPHYPDSKKVWTYTRFSSSLFPVNTNINGFISVHPVIEIPKNKISY